MKTDDKFKKPAKFIGTKRLEKKQDVLMKKEHKANPGAVCRFFTFPIFCALFSLQSGIQMQSLLSPIYHILFVSLSVSLSLKKKKKKHLFLFLLSSDNFRLFPVILKYELRCREYIQLYYRNTSYC